MKNSKEYLQEAVEAYGLGDCCAPLMENERFWVWSGSSKPHQHHYGDGGLALHTAEVVNLSLNVAGSYNFVFDLKRELVASALWHDYGKIWDYERVSGLLDTSWKGSDHKRMIHHVSRSAIEWNKAAVGIEKEPFISDVTHNILSHHGQRSWGSPVAPKSRASWVLHLCDGLSARMDDCDKLDILDR